MKGLLVFLLASGMFLAACAKKGTPSGGPVDDVRPVVLSVYPDSFATGVPVDTTLHLEFSERIDEETLDRALWIAPQSVVIKDISRDDLTLRVRFRKPLPKDATISVLLGSGVADRRGNTLAAPKQWVFSTGEEVARGALGGRVVAEDQSQRGATRPGNRGNQNAPRTLIGVFALGDTLPDFETEAPLALGEASHDGGFEILGLPHDSRKAAVVAFTDANGNYLTDAREEFVSAKHQVVTLTEERQELTLRLVDPRSPGWLAGVLARADSDSIPMGVELYPVEDDSLSQSVAGGDLMPDGRFLVVGIPSGAYRFVAYCDANGNRFRDPFESWTLGEDTVYVAPGDTTRLDTIRVQECSLER